MYNLLILMNTFDILTCPEAIFKCLVHSELEARRESKTVDIVD